MISYNTEITVLCRILITTLILVFCKVRACCQIDESSAARIDSLKAALVGSVGQNRYDILDRLAYEYVWIIDSLALPYASEAFTMSWQFGDSAGITKSGRVMAMVFNGLKQYDSTIAVAGKILPIARRNKDMSEVKRLLNLLALAHTHKAEFDKALAYNFESLDLRRKSGDSLSISIALNNVGLVYFKIENFIQAADYFKKSLDFLSFRDKTLNDVDKESYIKTFVNLSLSHAQLMDLKASERYLMKAKEYWAPESADRISMSLHFAAGLLQFQSGNLQTASASFLESLALARKLSDPAYELDSRSYLSEIFIRSNDLQQAERYLLEAEPILASATQFRGAILQAYGQLAKVYMKMGRYRETVVYQTKFIELSGKVYNNKLTANLMAVQAEHAEQENKAKIEAQEKILALSNDVIRRQRGLNVVTGIVAILSVAFVCVLIQNIRQKKRVNSLLEQRVKERTIELEKNHDLLLKSMRERDIETQRMSNEFRSSLATITGLGRLVLNDGNIDNASMYVRKIEETSNDFLNGLSSINSQRSDL